jgi:glyoxylase-like metal-dependent hydrolase (beta-lactamase superfamily II)
MVEPTYFRQMCDGVSRTYTYLIADCDSGQAALIDAVLGEIDLYVGLLAERGLRLVWLLETHVHADHITAAAVLRDRTGARVALGCDSKADGADRLLVDGDGVAVGGETIRVMATPGHTPGCVSYVWHERLFTGDALLIRSCGRTDLAGGDAGRLYDSLTRKLLSLPDETLVYPGHDYQGRRVSCAGEERSGNPYLAGRSRDEFVALMSESAPTKSAAMEAVVSANRRCGRIGGPADAAGGQRTFPPSGGALSWAGSAGMDTMQCAAAPRRPASGFA